MLRLAFVFGLLVFWSPPIAALINGRVGNALILLTPLAVTATWTWVIFLRRLSAAHGFGELGPGLKIAVGTAGLLMAASAALAVAVAQDWRTPFVIAIFWTIVVVVSPFGVWNYNRITRARARDEQAIAEYLETLPADKRGEGDFPSFG